MSEIQKWRKVAEKRGMPYSTYRNRIYAQNMTPEQAATGHFVRREESRRKALKEISCLVDSEIPDAVKVERHPSEIEMTITMFYRNGMTLSRKQLKYLSENECFFESLSQYNEERKKNMERDRKIKKKEVANRKKKRATHAYYVISEKLRYMIQKENMTYNSFSLKMDIHPTQFSNMLRLKMASGERARKNICEYFNCEESELFVYLKKGQQHEEITKLNEKFLKNNR